MTHSPSYLIHCLFYFFYYAYLGLFRPFMPSFLDSSGLGAKQIGSVFLLISAATLFSAPGWGRRADKHGWRSLFLTGFPLVAVIIMTPLIVFPGYYQAILIALVQGALVVPLVPLADAVTIERSHASGWRYGRIRLWGTVGFLLTSSFGGFLAEHLGWDAVMFVMMGVIFMLSWGGYRLKASSQPVKNEDTASSPSKSPSRFETLRRPVVFLFLAGTVLYQTAFGTYNLFFGIHIEKIAATSKWISIGWTIATLSEILFFTIVDSIQKKIGAVGIMALAMVSAIFRWFFLAHTDSLVVIVLLQVLHGVMLGGFTTGAVMFAASLFPSSQKTFAQGLHNAAYNGLGGILAAVVASQAYGYGGASVAYLISALLSVGAMICLILGPLSFEKRQKQGDLILARERAI